MNKLQCLFAAASLTLAALVIVLIVREYNTQWRPHQEEYKLFLQETAATDTQKEAANRFSISVRQDWLPDFNQADRCRSCHIGVDNPDAPVKEPLAPHPDLGQHTFQKFGCTVCHAGEGYATRLPDAHEYLLPQRTIDASCGKCHDSDAIKGEAPTFVSGQKLADRYNCNGCHQLAGKERRKNSGPEMSGLSAKVSAKWLAEWLKEPKKYLPHSRMGNFLLTNGEIQALTGYLVSNTWKGEDQFFVEDEADEQFLNELDEDAYDELVENGKVQFGRLRCLTCHSLHGRGGTLGPELESIGNKTTGRWIGAWLRSPSQYDSQTIMPTFRLSRAERLGIAEYLRLESEYMDEDEDEEIEEETKTEFSMQQKKNGAKFFVIKGCFNCHSLDAIPDSGEFAPSLADIANKKAEKISFGSAPVEHTLPDYIAAKLQAPRIFSDNLKMPFFDLPLEEVGRLTTFALGQASSIPPGYNQKTKPSDFELGGVVGQLVDRYRCLSCHKIQGKGGTLAPDLSAEGSKVQREWLIEYLQKPYAIRPTLVERMLRFNLDKKEATLLADYITLALSDINIDAYRAPDVNDKPEIGKTLYYEKYNCQSCHAIGTGGGYFGPALDSVGRRLKPNWMNARLENSHRFENNAKEPILAIPENDRLSLVSFLSSLRGEKK